LPACAALKILCRSRRTRCSYSRQRMASQSSGSSGPFTSDARTEPAVTSVTAAVGSPAAVPNLSLQFRRFIGSDSSKGHPAHVSSLSGPGTRPGMRPVIRRPPAGGTGLIASVFLLPFGRRRSLLGRPVPARTSALLPTGRRSFPPDRDGVTTFRTFETRPDSGASSTPGPWCSPGCLADVSQHCRLPAAALHPRPTSHHRGSSLRGLRGPWNFLPGFTPHGAVLRDACRERGQASSTHPELSVHTPSNRLVHSKGATSLSHRQERVVRHDLAR
jgi:hypothetical protein